ncbi:MAG: hypothetical protein Q9223_002260 [Gallowayella weberi]
MKSFIVSAVVGATIIGLSGVTTILGVEAAAIPTEDVKRSDAGSLATFTKRQDIIVTTPCWETEDGQVRCPPKMVKRQDCVVTTPCWETEDGQVRCAPKEKRDELEVSPPPAHVASGTTLKCASWWTALNSTPQTAPCLSALVSGQNISFAQFRQLNPSVDPNCGNLKVGCAYCVQGITPLVPIMPPMTMLMRALGASTASSSNNSADQPLPSAPLFPAVRATEAKTSTAPSSYAAPTLPTGGLLTSLGTVTTSNRNSVAAVATAQSASASVAAITSPPSSECRSVTFKDWGTVGSSSGYYDIDSAGHTCATHQIPPAYGPNPPPTTEADTDAPQTSSLAVTSGYAFGAPAQATASLTAATSLATGNVTAAGTALRDDGRCGLVEFNRATCDPNGEFGGCCSSHGYCGKTDDHCGAGCLSGCNNGTISITGARPTTKALESGVVVGPAGPQVSD